MGGASGDGVVIVGLLRHVLWSTRTKTSRWFVLGNEDQGILDDLEGDWSCVLNVPLSLRLAPGRRRLRMPLSLVPTSPFNSPLLIQTTFI